MAEESAFLPRKFNGPAVVSDSGLTGATRDHARQFVGGEVVDCSDGIRRDHNEISGQVRNTFKERHPKLGCCSLNLDTFPEIVGVVRPRVQYFSEVAGGAPSGMV